MKIKYKIFLILILFLSIIVNYDLSYQKESEYDILKSMTLQENSTIQNQINEPPEATDKDTFSFSNFEIILSISVLFFSLIVILTEIYIIKLKSFDPEQSIKFVLVTLIICAALFLITAGFSNDQIAPAMGLLGTVAGYLLGRMETNKNV